MSQEDNPLQRLLNRKLIICAGSGGVGKTTISAALGLMAARQGRRVLVLTIDPARRLADSLGVGPLGNEEVQIPSGLLREVGVPPEGELWALMLDAKSTFDQLVERLSPTPEIRDRILGNPYYQQISRSMVGSQEYMALDRLLSARDAQRYDLVVLDTPPSRHALDFLRAPGRLRGVLEEGVLNWLLKPSAFVLARMKLVGDGNFLQSLEKVIGLTMLGDLSEFVYSFRDLLGGFKSRATRSQDLLSDPDTAFALVTSPSFLAIREAAYFLEQIEQQGYAFAGFIINRSLPISGLFTASAEVRALRNLGPEGWRQQFSPDPPAGAAPGDYESLLEKLRGRLESFLALAEIDRENLGWLRRQAAAHHLFLQVPEMPSDVHDLRSLDALGRLMLEAAQQSAAVA